MRWSFSGDSRRTRGQTIRRSKVRQMAVGIDRPGADHAVSEPSVQEPAVAAGVEIEHTRTGGGRATIGVEDRQRAVRGDDVTGDRAAGVARVGEAPIAGYRYPA